MTEQQRAEAERILAEQTGAAVRPYFLNDFGREQNPEGASVVLFFGEAVDRLASVRAALPPGLVAFVGTTKWYGDERHEGAELVVGLGDDQFAILRLAKSDAANYDKSTEDLIRKLQEYDRDYGIQIFHAETDIVEFTLNKTPDDLAAFAQDLYEFCPDIVDQGVETVEALAESIEFMGAVYLWWD